MGKTIKNLISLFGMPIFTLKEERFEDVYYKKDYCLFNKIPIYSQEYASGEFLNYIE